MREGELLRPIDFIGSSRDDLRDFPDKVKQEIGYAFFEAQQGRMSNSAKPLRGFCGAGVLEILEDHRDGTYRAVYTVRFRGVIYVLHCFQKKSKRGIKTPQQELELIRRRLSVAEEDYRNHYSKEFSL